MVAKSLRSIFAFSVLCCSLLTACVKNNEQAVTTTETTSFDEKSFHSGIEESGHASTTEISDSSFPKQEDDTEITPSTQQPTDITIQETDRNETVPSEVTSIELPEVSTLPAETIASITDPIEETTENLPEADLSNMLEGIESEE